MGELEVLPEFRRLFPQHDKPRTFEEHGGTWVECLACGAQWHVPGPHFEEVTAGDGFCDDSFDR